VYRDELRAGFPWLRFRAVLEREFRVAHLAHVRARVRACLLVVAILGGLLLAVTPRAASAPWVDTLRPALIWPACALLALLAASRELFARYWLRAAPALLAVAGATGGLVAVSEQLAGRHASFVLVAVGLTLLYVAAGLLFWEALAAGLACALTYLAALVVQGADTDLLRYQGLVLLLVSVVGALLAALVDRGARTAYLHTRLLEDATCRDNLTSLANRRAFDRHLDLLWKQGLRDQAAVAILLVDIDNFKDYNDHFGHQAGDDCLKRIGRALVAPPHRPLDLAARLGGDEFAVILYGTSAEHLQRAGAEITRAVQDLQVAHAPGATHRTVTVSVGAALAVPQPDRSQHGLVQLADEALYDAKSQGRDRVATRAGDYQLLRTGAFQRGLRHAG
jgi:diguanylate cyclase (GGDEF)-like protein